MKKFDLNIEKILENWEMKHAIREIIANALDEQKLSRSREIEITKDAEGSWHIRDFGRGLRYEHFTQKENDEKLSIEGIIGKFGIGLKDALATIERKGAKARIISRFGDIFLGKANKVGFEDLVTLHAYIDEPSLPNFEGTDFILTNVSDYDITEAKKLFLKFNSEQVIEKTKYGEILGKKSNTGNIYINGVLVATEENFLFSYNITLINSVIRKAINRERANVGRTAYTGAVKSILMECQSKEIAEKLSEDLKQFSSGNIHDELKWIDVQQHAAKILNKYEKVVLVTHEELERGTDLIDEARKGGFQVIAISSALKDKIQEQNQQEVQKQEENPGQEINIVRIFSQFVQERSDNFEFKFVQPSELTYTERENLKFQDVIFKLIGGQPWNVREIVISETMQRDETTFKSADGLWDPKEQKIIIKRSVLQSTERFVAVLLHEVAHAISGATDATRRFESELTRLLGILGTKAAKD
ncbi:MAG TPA: ATP-binding protein [Haliscomenobacter sp.]|uniref:ATP-binding protein n=1 Tax=Haliscomenobacter sp. TaxID=2717303 RepID=UPI002D096356|nr:ATP-binding protein [Haliscomenobacter sp.]HOY16011.1 ATP-binding protein [Haliscomenobacter sp.]